MRALARLFLLLLLIVSAVQSHAQEPSPIKIGAFLAVTGDGAYVGAPQLATLQLYIELINKQGGVLGRPLQLTYYDVGIDTRSAQTAVHRLIDIDRVDVIIGGSTTGSAMAVVPLIEQAKIPYFALAESSALINPVNPWVFKTSPTDRIACAKILRDLKSRDLLKIAIVSGDSGFAVSMKEQCVTLAPDYGVNIIASQTYPSQTRRVTEPLQKLAGIPEIQAVLALDFGSAPPYLVQSYRKLAFKAPLYQTHVQIDDEYLDLAGESADGVRMPVPLLKVANDLPDNDPNRRILRAYIDAYRKRWDVAPNVYGACARCPADCGLGDDARRNHRSQRDPQ